MLHQTNGYALSGELLPDQGSVALTASTDGTKLRRDDGTVFAADAGTVVAAKPSSGEPTRWVDEHGAVRSSPPWRR